MRNLFLSLVSIFDSSYHNKDDVGPPFWHRRGLSPFFFLRQPFNHDAGPIALFAVIITSFGGIQEVILPTILCLRDSMSGRS